MTESNGFEVDRDGPWLSAYVDGELEPSAAARVERWLAESADARREVERLRALADLTAAFALRDAPSEAWEVFWLNFARRGERRLAWVLLIAGAAVVGAWGLVAAVASLWRAADLPIVVKAGATAMAAGLLLFLVSLVRERLYVRRRTRYKDIVR